MESVCTVVPVLFLSVGAWDGWFGMWLSTSYYIT